MMTTLSFLFDFAVIFGGMIFVGVAVGKRLRHNGQREFEPTGADVMLAARGTHYKCPKGWDRIEGNNE